MFPSTVIKFIILVKNQRQQVNVNKHDSQAPPHPTEVPEIDKQEMLNDPSIFPPHYHIPLSPNDLSHLLAADLAQNKKLSLETLIYLQSQDPHISYIKENLLAKKDMKTFRLKKDIVCRVHRNDEENSTMRIYVPSVLLYPIVVYIHKHFLHPSNSQMILEFSNLYYHPQAAAAIKKVGNACITCSLAKNPEYTGLADLDFKIIEPSGIDLPTRVYSNPEEAVQLHKTAPLFLFFSQICEW